MLRRGGLLFLVENTTSGTGAPHWKYRSVETYRGLCDFAALKHLDDYRDLGETISLLAGRAC